MSDTETSLIDEKKTGENGDIEEKWKDFSTAMATSVATIIYITLLGSFFLYSTKVARSNIIPTNFDTSPKSVPVNMNFYRDFEISFSNENIINIGGLRAQSANFVDGNNYIKYILELLESKGLFATYLHNLIKSFLQLNNSVTNNYFKFFYEMNESVTILLGGIIYIFLFLFYIAFHFLSLGLFNAYYLFELINNRELYASDKIDNWFIKFVINFSLTCIYYFWGIIGVFIGFGLSSMVCVFTAIYSLFSPLSYSYSLGDKKKHGILTFLFDLFSYKKLFFMTMISLAIIKNAGSKLGTNYGVGAFLAVIILLLMGVYNDIIKDDSTLKKDIFTYESTSSKFMGGKRKLNKQ